MSSPSLQGGGETESGGGSRLDQLLWMGNYTTDISGPDGGEDGSAPSQNITQDSNTNSTTGPGTTASYVFPPPFNLNYTLSPAIDFDIKFNGTESPSAPTTNSQTPPLSPTLPPPLQPQQVPPPFPQPNMIVVGVLIGLIVVLGMVLGIVTIPPLINWFRRKLPVSQRRIDRRYSTIDGWLITKTIKPHDTVCERVRRYYGLEITDGDEEMGMAAPYCQPVGTTPRHRTARRQRTLKRQEVDHLLATESVASLQNKLQQKQQREREQEQNQRQQQHLDATGTGETAEDQKEVTDGKTKERRNQQPPSLKQTTSFVSTATATTNSTTETLNSLGSSPDDIENQPNRTVVPPYENPDSVETVQQKLAQPANDMGNVGAEEDDGDDDSRCPSHACPICLETFVVDDMVSWSASKECRHVFHYTCLREWLLRRIVCPCCRETVLPVDRPPPPMEPPLESQDGPLVTRLYHSAAHQARNRGRRRWLPKSALQELASERATRAATTYFCIHDGLVTLLPQALNHPVAPISERQLELQRRLKERQSAESATLSTPNNDDESRSATAETNATTQHEKQQPILKAPANTDQMGTTQAKRVKSTSTKDRVDMPQSTKKIATTKEDKQILQSETGDTSIRLGETSVAVVDRNDSSIFGVTSVAENAEDLRFTGASFRNEVSLKEDKCDDLCYNKEEGAPTGVNKSLGKKQIGDEEKDGSCQADGSKDELDDAEESSVYEA